ncbi:hypothetical protein FNO01nite_14400 [Flavobacterium noncentrifugens]|uniref:histidine kinase n=1 Tax=Flavobacterium noncentrifugens TaxID=1128970 RepID=A0A1G8W4V0_9FLAO|nr:ATP-binding protein [Flavobacterium noncentrifugens]GEP50768.1 hypothetical protein FNO01nite_14400 [Flavobacterium noncentrifugens]SDJ73133.1 hypothetical protein SAMN04487935_1646 [Flavobacterium noncentrifugens]
MIAPQIPKNEKARLDALMSYKILDTLPEKDFDDITRLAAEICNVPISLITLVDENRQWFKSKVGLDGVNETSRIDSFCAHAINNPDELFVIEDAAKDKRFFDNPLVVGAPAISCYAGVPLLDANGFALGSLCVIDDRPRKLDEHQLQSLKKLGNQVSKLLELRKNNDKLVESHNTLLSRYKDLEQFSSVVSHDIKSPLNNIMQLTQLFKEEYGSTIDANGNQMLDYISQSSEELKKLVDGILNYYKYENLDVDQKEEIQFRDFTKYIIGLLKIKNDFKFVLPEKNIVFYSNTIALGQIMYNLISNSIKYNDKEKGLITIGFNQTETQNIISVSDNGCGIDPKHFDKIFEVFQTLGQNDRFNTKGTGLGLSTVRKMADKLHGSIEVESIKGEGTTFKVILRK